MEATGVRNAVILAGAVDAADKALLPATFKALSLSMQVGPRELGALTFAQSIAFSLALPLWGSLLRHHCARRLLVAGCCLWGTSTLLIAATGAFWEQFLLRLFNGAALAAVNPIGQAVLCDVVPEAERGRAFGLMASACSVLTMIVGAATTAAASRSIGGLLGWRVVHLALAAASFLVALLLHLTIPSDISAPGEPSKCSWFAEQREVVRKILRRPSFVILVLQGVTGGIPWNSFAFMPLFFQLSGYTDLQAGEIVFYGGIGGALGGYLGGVLGDHFGRLFPSSGRMATAQASVLLGAVLFVWVTHVPYGPSSFFIVAIANFLFHLTACWAPAAACRPICGSLFRDSRDRAQVLALWIALEGISSSVLGAPLAGLLSEAFGFRLARDRPPAADGAEGAAALVALRKALMGVAIVPWVLCFLAWVPMYWAFPEDCCAEGKGQAARAKADIHETSALRQTRERGETYKAITVQVDLRP